MDESKFGHPVNPHYYFFKEKAPAYAEAFSLERVTGISHRFALSETFGFPNNSPRNVRGRRPLTITPFNSRAINQKNTPL
jgi:hypothetical protein